MTDDGTACAPRTTDGQPSAPAPDATRSAVVGQRAAERLLAELRQEVARADTKASVLAGAQGVTAAAAVGFLGGEGWHPSSLSPAAQAVWWTGASCFLVSLCSLLLAVVPRYRSGSWQPGTPVTYFGDICSASRHGPQAVAAALIETERTPMPGLVASLMENSRIVAGKHWWIRSGLASITAAVVLLPAALLLG
ncbi:Pycsar system effector family protein [Streptomyces ovatisporus]|uniref:Pycsar system effector family protein n=1 Tax=Streptomyces ovatisporus TaxID=1128682 RepID=A0ABV9A319_9ACTN